ncbi:MAG: beta-lactamase family protein [Acholeplasmatales bacterium]|nr:beta-lactamase family protein [Acholeplasmatales bacterium]
MIELTKDCLRDKVIKCYDTYINISNSHTLAIGIYYKGNCYFFGNGINKSYRYDIGSITKTMTAHLILYLSNKGLIDINKTIDQYLTLKKGKYPTIYELLTHTAGYNHLTPIQITLPHFLRNGKTKKNLYEGCNEEDIIKCLEKNNKHKEGKGYCYSDFSYAILSLVARTVTKTDYYLLFQDFINNVLHLKDTSLFLNEYDRRPLAIHNKKILDYCNWNKNNPYIASGGLISNISDMVKYISLEIEGDDSYIKDAHIVCPKSFNKKNTIGTCLGWHTYKNSNQLWHVGSIGTFRSSIIINKKNEYGVVVLGNANGKKAANVHYLAKMLYCELKLKKIKLKEFI